MLYACMLKSAGLPTDGLSFNGSVLSNDWAMVEYLNSLSDEEKIVFIHIIEETYYRTGISNGYDLATDEEASE